MMAMATPADVPQGIILNRDEPGILFGRRRGSGCAGGSQLAVQTTAPTTRAVYGSGCNGSAASALAPAGCNGGVARVEIFSAAAARERRGLLFGNRRGEVGGCSGSAQTFRVIQQAQIYQTVVPVQRAAGCSGGGLATTAVVQQQPTGGTEVVGDSARMGVGRRHVFLRLELAHAINHQERQGKMTAADAQAARAALANPQTSAGLLARVDAHYNANPPARMTAAGDHPLLDWFVQNWSTILQMIKDVIALFGYVQPAGLERYAAAPAVDYALAA